MISESRWTGTTLKFGLNIEQSLGHSVAEGQPRLLGRRPPTLSSTLPTRRPKLFDGTSLIWIWRSCEDIKSWFAPRSISSKVIPLGPWDLWRIYWRESGRLLKSLKLWFSQTFLTEVHNTPPLSVADSLKIWLCLSAYRYKKVWLLPLVQHGKNIALYRFVTNNAILLHIWELTKVLGSRGRLLGIIASVLKCMGAIDLWT